MTLVEVIVYIGLLSVLMMTIVRYMISIHAKNNEIHNKVNNAYDKRGFGAVTAVIMISFGMFFFALVNSISVNMYADSINKRELRIQASLNADSCIDRAKFFLEFDRFLIGSIEFSEFGCVIDIEHTNSGAGLNKYDVSAVATLSGVKSYKNMELEIER